MIKVELNRQEPTLDRTRPILALDMARLLGFADWNGRRLVDSGTVELTPPGAPVADVLLSLWRWLANRKATSKPKLWVTYEMPISYGNRTGVGRGFNLEGVLLLFCRGRDLSYHSLPQPTLKKHATDNGRATKDLMVDAARERWGFWPDDDNEADALCILGWTLDEGLPLTVDLRRKK